MCELVMLFSLLVPCEIEPVDPEPEYEPEEVIVEKELEDEEVEKPEVQVTRGVWDDLADCESGNWIDGGRSFETGSARWDWAAPWMEVPSWGTTVHHGGLQFHPDTWDWLKPEGFPERAYEATREQQIEVAEAVLEAQGWRAWPVCSQKLGLR